MKATWTIGPEDFEKLLAWLDPDRDRAAEKYEKMRQRLIKMLVCRGCWEAEDLVDETMDRVAHKIGEIRESYVGDPAAYFGGVARHVYQEWLRKKRVPPVVPDPDPMPDSDPEAECLDDCMGHLAANNRDLILEYYKDDKQAKIQHRKAIAEREGLEVETLRLRIYRIRKVLRDCVLKCLDHKVTANEWIGGHRSIELQ